MSLDRSLKSANSLVRHRNVLTRAERLEKLTEEEKWDPGKSVYGLPKVAHRKAAVVKTVKEDTAETVGATADAAGGAATGTAAKGAGGAAQPAKGATAAKPGAATGAAAAGGKGKK